MNLKRLALVPLAVALFVTAACSGGGDTIVQNSPNAASGISAAGSGKVTGTPDVAVLQLGVDVELPTVEAARASAANSMNAALAALKADGVDDKDIKTVQFTINPQYDYNGSKQTLRAYRVSNVVSAKVRKVDTVGKVVDDVSKAAGDSAVVRSLSFTIDDPTKLQAQARDLAVKQARERADQLAQPAGVKVGKVLAITESSGSTNVPFAAQALAAPRTGGSDTPIQTGDMEIVVNVTATFAID